MNYIILEVANRGLSASVYGWINTAAVIISFLYSLLHGKRMGISLWKMFLILLTVHLGMGAVQSGIYSVLLYIKEVEFLGITTAVNSIVRIFIFIPPMAWILAKIFKLKPLLVCDAVAFFPFLRSALAQLACVFTGCCRGYPCEWGIHSIQTGMNHFPTPIVETVLTLLIFAYLTSVVKGKKYTSDGILFPHMMILYGIMRFICEWLRSNEKVFLGCSGMAVHAVLITIVGAVWMLILSRKKEITYGHSIQTLQTQEGENGKDTEGSQGREGSQV